MRWHGEPNAQTMAGVQYRTMSDAIYRIVRREDESFAVEIARSGVLPQTATGFISEADAQSWIAQDQRLWAAADPFRTEASRRRRGY